MDGGEQAMLDRLVAVADPRLERRDHVADHIFRRIVQQTRQAGTGIEPRRLGARQRLDQQDGRGDRENMRALRLPLPARHAREPVRDVVDLDVERRGVEQIEPPPRQHALPGARRCLSRSFARLAHWRLVNLAQAAWRWHMTRWSLTMPTACMKA